MIRNMRVDKVDHYTYEGSASGLYFRLIGVRTDSTPAYPNRRFIAGLAYTQDHEVMESICSKLNYALTMAKEANDLMAKYKSRRIV